jgi:hypothetical protein
MSQDAARDIGVRPVWCVWTEWGEYEQFSRDLRGVFATAELATAHADQLEASDRYDVVEVVADEVMTTLPTRVPYVCWSAHIKRDGTEDRESGFKRGKLFDTWSNELAPLGSAKCDKWSGRDIPDLFIEVVGSDPEMVATEYGRLLALAREQLAS